MIRKAMKHGFLKKSLEYEPMAGSSIDNCITECRNLAIANNAHILIHSFNGVDIPITPTTTQEEALAYWQKQIDANAEAYRSKFKQYFETPL